MLGVACLDNAPYQVALIPLMYKTPASLPHPPPASPLWKKYTGELKMETQSEIREQYKLSNHMWLVAFNMSVSLEGQIQLAGRNLSWEGQ